MSAAVFFFLSQAHLFYYFIRIRTHHLAFSAFTVKSQSGVGPGQSGFRGNRLNNADHKTEVMLWQKISIALD